MPAHKDIDDDRKLVEAIRRERGKLTRNALMVKYHISLKLLKRLIAEYSLSVAPDPTRRVDRKYDLWLAKRQIAVEIENSKKRIAAPYKPGPLEW